MSVLDKFKKQNEVTKKGSIVKSTKKPKETTAKKVAKKDSDVKKKQTSLISKEALEVILKPVVSEKSAHLSDNNVLVLHVAKRANKVQIKHAFRELYNVTPKRVNILNMRGKRVRFGKSFGKRSDYKKALVSLPKGVSVDLFEGV